MGKGDCHDSQEGGIEAMRFCFYVKTCSVLWPQYVVRIWYP